jgi:hypothetical protein
LRISDAMTVTNGLLDTGVDTSSEAADGWCGSQPMLSILFTPLSIAVTAIHIWNVPIKQCPQHTIGERQR